LKQEKKRTTLYLTSISDEWLTEQSKKQGISKNDVIQILINGAMETEATRHKGLLAP
jgi:hypothetical protein